MATASLPAETAPQALLRGRIQIAIASALFLCATSWIIWSTLRACGGQFVFGLDDTYINMAVAKNLALHGVWGVTRYAFSSSTSTPLYVVILALVYRIFGVSEFAPLLLSWTFGLCAILVCTRILRRYVPERWMLPSILAVSILSPIFAIAVLGMEHSLHVLLTVAFLDAFTDDKCAWWSLAGISALMTATRYEGMLVAGSAAVVLLAARRLGQASTVLLATALPILTYAAFSITHGGYWLPNSIAMKGIRFHGSSLGETIHRLYHNGILNSIRAPHLFFLILGLFLSAIAAVKPNRRAAMMAGAIVPAGVLQLTAGDVGWGFRYEAYLVVAAITVAIALLSRPAMQPSAWRRIGIAALFCSLFFLFMQSLQSVTRMPRYSRAIYLQQIQMARFLHDYFPNSTVAANDIGAITFFNDDLHCIDLVGLGDNQVFAAKRAQTYSTDYLAELTSARGAQLAVVYDTWFQGVSAGLYFEGPELPKTWILEGQWYRPEDELVPLGDTTVSFYAIAPSIKPSLAAALRQFGPNLPPPALANTASRQ